jgi:small subunit ribosomal protein S8
VNGLQDRGDKVIMSDPIADMLNRIRNAAMVGHDSVMVPASKTKLALSRILKEEGFIGDYRLVEAKPHQMIKIALKYGGKNAPIITGLKRVSKPGLRVYVQRTEIPRVYGGLGIAILSTPKGIMTGKEAWRGGTGGELLCYIW